MSQYREMTFGKKLASILSFTEVVEDFAPKVVQKELGKEKLQELQNIWKQGVQPIPAGASEKEKYEIAYKNFMWKWVSANNFMRKNQGDAGIAAYMRAAISGWKKKYAQDAFRLKIIGGLSRGSAFKVLAKRLAYQLQVFSPFAVIELDVKHMTLVVTPCKILQDRNGLEFCLMACQNIIPSWLQAQFNIKMILNRQGDNCTVTFEPFST
jgi:hypothetical protein